MIRPSAAAIALAAIASAAACEKASSPDTPVTKPPDQVVVTVSTASLAKAARGLRAYIDGIRPGGSAAMSDVMIAAGLASAVGAGSLDGLDLAGPLHLVVVDKPTRLALVGKIADRAALDKARGGVHVVVRDGWAVVGPKEVVQVIERWAVPGLVAARPATSVEATVHVDRLMTRHAAAITEMRQALTAQLSAADPGSAMVGEYMTGLTNLAGDTARLTASLAVDAERAELDLALVPRPSSGLAGFVAAQKPSDFGLIGSLPGSAPAGMLMAGHVSLGPYRDRILAVMTRMMNVGSDDVGFAKTFASLAELTTGEFAAGFTMAADGMSMVEVVPVSDSAAAEKLIRSYAISTKAGTQGESMGIRMTQTGHPDVATHEGAVIHGLTTTVDLASVPESQREMFARMYKQGQEMHVGFPERALVATMGGVEVNKQAIDALRGKGRRLVLGAGAASFFDAARARRDSLVLVLDLAATLAALRGDAPASATAPDSSLAFSAGFADRAAHLRMTLPAASVRAVMAAAGAPP